MRRALQLAKNGEGRVSPNPMVGAVIVHNDRIIGEGFHAYFGGPHAEVNAINSVRPEDKELLKDSTIYVTLEPCSHYGKTPPCANLIISTGIPNVVVGSLDPNPLVAGRGLNLLETAGVNVKCGILEEECRELNRKFMKAQTSELPYILLKWAQSSDGYIAGKDEKGNPLPIKFSNPLSTVLMHRVRSTYDAIMVGGNTERLENPGLDNRLWGGDSPKKYVAHYDTDLRELLKGMRKEGITSLMVEGGSILLDYFINQRLFDEIRVETSPIVLGSGIEAPRLPEGLILKETSICRNNLIQLYRYYK